MTLFRRTFFALAVLWGASAPAFAQTPLTADEAARVDAAVRKMMDATHTTAAAIAVAKDGEIVYANGYGTTDEAGTADITAGTPFEIGSVTKGFTAAAVMQLVDAHKVRLDDRVSRYVPEYPAARTVTVRQLLYQVSGIPDYTETKNFVKWATTKSDPGSVPGILRLIAGKPLEFPPGTKWAYSNTNYILLGRIIEIASREPYDAYIRKHILEPAGMTHTVTIAGEKSLHDFPVGYARENGAFVPAPRFAANWAWAAGNLVSTVGDLVRWDREFFRGHIVPPRDVTLMTTPLKLPNGTSTNYGFGWVADTQSGHKRIWHNGGTFGFGAANVNYPDEHLTIVAFINQIASPPQGLATSIFNALHPAGAAASYDAVRAIRSTIAKRSRSAGTRSGSTRATPCGMRKCTAR